MPTVHAVLELTESISNYIDSKQHCAGVFIDLKKDFDTVNHKLLVEKLSFYRVLAGYPASLGRKGVREGGEGMGWEERGGEGRGGG